MSRTHVLANIFQCAEYCDSQGINLADKLFKSYGILRHELYAANAINHTILNINNTLGHAMGLTFVESAKSTKCIGELCVQTNSKDHALHMGEGGLSTSLRLNDFLHIMGCSYGSCLTHATPASLTCNCGASKSNRSPC